MYKIVLLLIFVLNLNASKIEIRQWDNNTSYLRLLSELNLPSRPLYWDMEKEKQKLTEKISIGTKYEIRRNNSGMVEQVIIPTTDSNKTLYIFQNGQRLYEFKVMPNTAITSKTKKKIDLNIRAETVRMYRHLSANRLYDVALRSYDVKEQVELLELSGEKGHPDAQYFAAKYYHDGRGSKFEPENYVSPNFKKSIYWYKEVIANNTASDRLKKKAKFDLALMYLKGDGVKKNYNTFLTLYEEMNANTEKGKLKLGYDLFNGTHLVKQDYKRSLYWYSKVHDTCTNKSACLEATEKLGYMYYFGLAVSKDVQRTYDLYNDVAFTSFYPDANYIIGLMYFKGEIFKQDKRKSLKYFELGTIGNPKASVMLAELYCTGKVVLRDLERCAYFAKQAYDKQEDVNDLWNKYELWKYINQDSKAMYINVEHDDF